MLQDAPHSDINTKIVEEIVYTDKFIETKSHGDSNRRETEKENFSRQYYGKDIIRIQFPNFKWTHRYVKKTRENI